MVEAKNLLTKKSFVRPSNVLVNYDYVDVANRQGYVIFDGFTDASGSYHLSGDALYSKDLELTSNNLQGTTHVLGTFETSSFNYPAIVNGTVFIICSFQSQAGAGSGNSAPNILLTFYHNDTELGNVATHTIAADAATAETSVVSFDVSDEAIKIGDTLKVKVTARETGGSRATVIHFACSPSDDVDTYVDTADAKCTTTRLIVAVPFKIDI